MSLQALVARNTRAQRPWEGALPRARHRSARRSLGPTGQRGGRERALGVGACVLRLVRSRASRVPVSANPACARTARRCRRLYSATAALLVVPLTLQTQSTPLSPPALRLHSLSHGSPTTQRQSTPLPLSRLNPPTLSQATRHADPRPRARLVARLVQHGRRRRAPRGPRAPALPRAHARARRPPQLARPPPPARDRRRRPGRARPRGRPRRLPRRARQAVVGYGPALGRCPLRHAAVQLERARRAQERARPALRRVGGPARGARHARRARRQQGAGRAAARARWRAAHAPRRAPRNVRPRQEVHPRRPDRRRRRGVARQVRQRRRRRRRRGARARRGQGRRRRRRVRAAQGSGRG